MTDAERFWSKVEKLPGPDACWLWRGAVRGGYGAFWVNNRVMDAHVYAYEIQNGPVPPGKQLHHECFTKACVRHTVPVSQKENRAQERLARTRCSHGHLLEGANVLIETNRHGNPRYRCRQCRNEQQQQLRKG